MGEPQRGEASGSSGEASEWMAKQHCPSAPVVSWGAMAEDTTRRLLKAFGMAVTDLEEAVEGAQGDAARRADAVLRERMKEIIELVETLSERAATL